MEHEFPLGIFRPEKEDYLFRCSVAPGNFPLERPKNACSIYFPTGFSRIFVLNGKQSKTSRVVSLDLATEKEKPAQVMQAIAKCAIVPMQMHCLYFWNSQHPVVVSGV